MSAQEYYNLVPPQEHVDRFTPPAFAGRPLGAIPEPFRTGIVHKARESYAKEQHPHLWQAKEQAGQELKAQGEAQHAQRQKDAARNERRRNRNTSNAQFYFHGTAVDPRDEPPENILPAAKHGGGVMHPMQTDPGYAYATRNIHTAQHYAQLAALSSPDGYVRRVYKVAARGRLEQDPLVDAGGNSRGTSEDDFRSKHGFSVRGIQWQEEPHEDH